MKAILMIDLPKDCWDCHLVDEWENCNAIKVTSNKYGMSIKQYGKERPSWCPLRPLPQRYDEGAMREQKGWNRCLDEILGETE